MKKLISVVVPSFNEEENIAWFNGQLADVLKNSSYNFEVIYVNDGSSDNTLNELKALAEQEKSVTYISFSRNFGKEAATTAGIHAAKGDAVIMLDSDGQHPPKLIPDMINLWEAGAQVVIGVRKSNVGEGFIKKYGSKFFYKILNSLTNNNTVPGSTDFRLIDRRVATEFNRFTERGRITRGLIDWLGFKREYFYFEAPERHAGTAAYSVGKLVKLAFHAFVSQSTKPLQAVGLLGLFVMALSFFTGIAVLLEKFAFNDSLGLAISGTAILAIFLSFLVGLVLACQGLLALYVESIHNETQNRPLYIIDESTIS